MSMDLLHDRIRIVNCESLPECHAWKGRVLYLSDVDPKRAAWLAYDVRKDGTVTNGRVFFYATRWRKDPFFGPDGFKLDWQGNIFGARPAG